MDNVKEIRVICQCLRTLNVSGYRSVLDDHRTQKLFSGTAIELHVIAQLLQLPTYDVITEQLRAHPQLQQAIGLESISSAQLSRKTNSLCTQTLQQIFYQLIRQIDQKTKSGAGITPNIGRLHIIDATDISLPALLGSWARCGSRKTGVRLHVRVVVADPDTVFPDRVIASTVNVRENKVVLDMVVEDDVTYVMDRGYESFPNFQTWVTDKKLFVVRVRDRTHLYPISGSERESVPSVGPLRLLQDVDVLTNKTTTPLRLVEFEDDKGRRYRLITSRWDLTAAEIAYIYKNRWKIELFFKWMKQHLKLVNLHGCQPDSVWNQLFLSLIAFAVSMLVKLALQTGKSQWSLLQLLRMYMYHPWKVFMQELNRPPTRLSKGRQKVDSAGKAKQEPQRIILH
jgi:hypothetical protein